MRQESEQLQGQPPLRSGRGGPRPPSSHHLTLWRPLGCHGNCQALSRGGSVLPVPLLPVPPEGSSSEGTSERSGPGEATASGLRRTVLAPGEPEAPCEEVVGQGTRFHLPATWALYCLYF
uniref:Insulin like growth factor binding protein 5 n=1 Tax=Molossus molossus TaxID=27622 RepID=A0A7J8FRL5_MOLMO|nr:insulin like growth factor binding protein 5 [Molossus molossus]